ncbi:Serine/threonine kinase [Hibiscus syriacus]|uniref:Receptor-like serine/threonine-protein kinase n=1 Tax=Hibiscus syriacus TaxID=106335 RepID=A0A6A2YAD7_HIBSY|nr:G-type lectin S-receptor-like serine/threonine-protein kinase At4g27290 [Hibiscus syriacus]KAE8674446.1 Serine/threonine kinase [Hibiscus syriacus]
MFQFHISSMAEFILLLLCSFLWAYLTVSIAVESLNTSISIRDGDTLVSAGGVFELGFFRTGSSSRRYLGIWYTNSVTSVPWVANREVPLNDTSGVVEVTNQGTLVLLDGNRSIIWSSNVSRPVRNPVVQLLDSGNLVVKDELDSNPGNFIWQSFDYPGNTFIAGMKIGRDLRTGLDRYLSSWKTHDDPSAGKFTYQFELGGFPEIVVREGSTIRFRSGPYNGERLSGLLEMKENPMYTYDFVFNDNEVYLTFIPRNNSILLRGVLSSENGAIEPFSWIDPNRGWIRNLPLYVDNCDRYALCGANGICDNNRSPVCSCMRGFVPRSSSEWEATPGTGGCVRKTQLNCSGDYGFIQVSAVKVPETKHSWYNYSLNLEECKNICLANCSCTAYANLNITNGGSGCLLWFNDLIDTRYITDSGQDIYVKVAASELDQNVIERNKARSNANITIIAATSSSGVLIAGLTLVVFLRRKKNRKKGLMTPPSDGGAYDYQTHEEDLELPVFDLRSIIRATSNFSIKNILGEGGFGCVYKGVLKNGQEIAVKRLSKSSNQGLDEFTNEVKHISKLQHRNLVKLLGCCIQADEKMLIYEYMPNKSLDFFIFDQARSMLLDWPMCKHIVDGIARGLLYLHQDSRQRIIHRDLKAGNVLLDNEMNARISDFGLARSFGEKETIANTKRVVGTFGYMSPEYAIDGLYSIKSDVFSFGVLVLEIVSGKKNRGFSHPDHQHNLLGHAWRLFCDGNSMELAADGIKETCNRFEVLRLIHVGLLCVQRSLVDRPSMSDVVLMLSSEVPLQQPKQPGFFTERDLVEAANSSACSNDFAITVVEAR